MKAEDGKFFREKVWYIGMDRLSSLVLGVLMVCLLGVAGVAASSKPAPAKETTATKSARASTKAVPAKKVTATKSVQPFTKVETLKGTLSMVQLNKGIIVVTNPSGVPFDFKVAHSRIDINGSPAKTGVLATEVGKEVSVRFLPFRSGDFAEIITIGG
jgi:glucose/arabinose dehydrogenase